MFSKTILAHLFHYIVALLISTNTFALQNGTNDGLTLDRATDITNTTNWKLSSTTLTKWFEYFDNTSQLTGNRPGTCSEVISSSFNNLDDVEGIWVACDDPTLPLECSIYPSCYPEISFSNGGFNPIPLRYVKMRIALLGFATLRFNVGQDFCIDYSYRKDPMSRCQYVEILSMLEWVDVEISTDDGIDWGRFSIQLFSRFKRDAVLVDKIEAFEYFVCESEYGDHYPCASTTLTSTVSTTIFPSSTYSDGVFTSILDVESDASLPVDYKWELPNITPKWMEYFVDYQNLLDQKNDTATCANLISSNFTSRNLPNVPGIWSSCLKSRNCDSYSSSCHPVISYTPPDEHYIYSIKSKFHLQDTAMIKLYAAGKCWDFKFENVTTPPCQLIRLSQLGDRWHDFFWTGQMFLPNQKAMEFQLELIAESVIDVVLLDIIEVQYKKCENIDNCSSEPTTPPELTSTVDYSTTEEDTTTNFDTSTTTTESDLTISTTITAKTSDLTDTTDSIDTTTTTDIDGTISTTTTTSTTTQRSRSSVGPIINMNTFTIAAFVLLMVK